VDISKWETALEELNAALELAETRLAKTYRSRADIQVDEGFIISYMKSGNRWGIYLENGNKTMRAGSVEQRVQIAFFLVELEKELISGWQESFNKVQMAIKAAREFAERREDGPKAV